MINIYNLIWIIPVVALLTLLGTSLISMGWKSDMIEELEIKDARIKGLEDALDEEYERGKNSIIPGIVDEMKEDHKNFVNKIIEEDNGEIQDD